MKHILFFTMLMIGTAVCAQDFVMKKKLADRYYERYDYSKAIPMYEQVLKSYPRRGSSFVKAYENLRPFFTDSASYLVRKVSFNSDQSDFSPMYYKDGFLFASARHKFSMIHMWYNWTSSSYLDLFFARPDEATVTSMDKGINTKYHEGPMTFTKTQDTIIFTRSNFYKMRFRTSTAGVNKLKLYQASYSANRKTWVNVTPLSINNDEYSVGHPALSADGRDLYFTSDMTGGFGGTDIYVSHRSADSTGRDAWGKPVNLGSGINSPGNEMFPFIDNEGNLWFASNGLPGLGGLDVFVARKTGNGFAKPVNPGFPINTRFDDFGYITRNSGKDGFISSDRFNGVGNDDIYSITMSKLSLTGLVCDSSNHNILLEGATVSLLTSDNVVIGKTLTATDGKFSFPLKFGLNYVVKVSKSGYAPRQRNFSTQEAGAGMDMTIPLGKEAIPKVEFFCTIVDKSSGEKLEGVHIVMKDSLTHAIVLDTMTSAEGGFRKTVPSVKLNDNLVYTIQIIKKGYLAKSVLFLHKVNSYQINLNDFLQVTLDKIDLGIDIGKLLDLKPIYFDLGKANIRPDAAKELDKVVKAMNENPGIRIELGSHTDSRGTAVSNIALSEKRAKSAAAYLNSKGIVSARIVSKGYGDTMPINQCVKGVKCSEEEYQINRRTEFKILSIE